MKRMLIIFTFVASTFPVIAQPNKIDARLQVKYSIEELNTLKEQNPKELKFLTYCIDNAFIIGDLPEEKVKANPTLYKEIIIKTIPVSNFFDLKIDILEDKSQYFIIKGTKKLLIVKSKTHILRELK